MLLNHYSNWDFAGVCDQTEQLVTDRRDFNMIAFINLTSIVMYTAM